MQIDRSGPFFTVFLTHSGAMGLQIRQKLSSLGPIFADRRPKSDRLLAHALHVGLPLAWFPKSFKHLGL